MASRHFWWKKLIGVGIRISIMIIKDEDGNRALAICGGGGISYISGGIIDGYQNTEWYEERSICQMNNIDVNLKSGGVAYGRKVGVAIESSPSHLTTIIGVGKGSFGGSLGIVSGCWLPNYKKRCKKWEECIKRQMPEILLQQYQSRGGLKLPLEKDPYECCRGEVQ